MNQFEARLMVLSQKGHLKVLRVAIKVFWWNKSKMAAVILKILYVSFEISSDERHSKCPVFASDLELLIEVNEYY